MTVPLHDNTIDLISRLKSSMQDLRKANSTDALIFRRRASRESHRIIPDFTPEIILPCLAAAEQLVPALARRGKSTLRLHRLLSHLRAANSYPLSYRMWNVWDDLLPRLEAFADRVLYDGGREMSQELANLKAIELAEKDPGFVHGSQRAWARAIGCSDGLVSKLPFWQKTMRLSGRQRKGRAANPKAVSLTPTVENAVGEHDAELQRLIGEQRADDRRRRVGSRERV